MYETWDGQPVFIFSNNAVNPAEIAVAKAARQYDPAKERRQAHIWTILSLIALASALAMVFLSLGRVNPDGTMSADAALVLLAAFIPFMVSMFSFSMYRSAKRYARNMDAYLATSPEDHDFDIVDGARPFWRGIIDSTPGWNAIADEIHHRTALGSELTGMICREWLRCPQTFEAAPAGSARYAELLEQGKHFGLRMHSKHILHHRLLAQASA